MNNNKLQDISPRTIWLLFSIAAISFIFTLQVPHIGEEGVYTVSSFEMWYHKHYFYSILYGEAYGRPPFFNWLILSLTKVVGWSHMLLASRLITATATIGTGLLLAWLVRNIFHDKRFAAFSALAYLVTDVLLYHGWLAYADPLFGFCIFAAIACLWVACERKSFGLLLLAVLGLIAAFLTKSLTAYVFYITAFLVLFGVGKYRFLLHPVSIALHLLVLSVPLLWSIFINDPGSNRLIYDIFYCIFDDRGIKLTKYLIKFITFPPEIFVRMLPISAIAAYYFWRGDKKPKVEHEVAMKFLVLFVGLSFLPYWISSKHASRYVLPLYPFIALWCSYIVWNTNMQAMRVALRWLIVIIIIKYITIIFWWKNYPVYYGCGGDYIQVARDVVERTNGFPLYTNHYIAVDSVIDVANILRYPLPPVHNVRLLTSKDKDYFVLTRRDNYNNFSLGKIVYEHKLGKDGRLYLLCYGKACS